jgi:hypothetical protein
MLFTRKAGRRESASVSNNRVHRTEHPPSVTRSVLSDVMARNEAIREQIATSRRMTMRNLFQCIAIAAAGLYLVGYVVPIHLLRCFGYTGHKDIPLEIQVVDSETLAPIVGAQTCWIPAAIAYYGSMNSTNASRVFDRLNGKLTDKEGYALLEGTFSGGGQGHRFRSQWHFTMSGHLWIRADGYDPFEIPLTNIFGRTAFFTNSITPLNQVIQLPREKANGQ